MEKIYDKILLQYGEKIGNIFSAIIVLIVGYIISRIVSRMIMKYIERSTIDEIILNFVHTILKGVFFIVILLMSLSELDVNISSLLALATALAAGVALALKETIASFIDGIKILFAKPFVKGDVLEVSGVLGTIQEIGLLYTTLLTLDNKKVILPNTEIANTVLINYSSEQTRRVDLYFDISYDNEVEKAKQIILDVTSKHPLYLEESPIFLRVSEYKESSVSLLLRVWTRTENFENFKFDLIEQVRNEFDKQNISIPYNQLDVHVHTNA